MYERQKIAPPALIGACSLLVIFSVLCLTVFALLSLSTVQADEKLAQAAEQIVLGYYRADAEAEQIVARLRAGERVDGVQNEGARYAFTRPVSDTQALLVRLQITDADYEILSWQLVSTTDWQADERLLVWDGT